MDKELVTRQVIGEKLLLALTEESMVAMTMTKEDNFVMIEALKSLIDKLNGYKTERAEELLEGLQELRKVF